MARKRADGAAPGTLFVADTLAALQQEVGWENEEWGVVGGCWYPSQRDETFLLFSLPCLLLGVAEVLRVPLSQSTQPSPTLFPHTLPPQPQGIAGLQYPVPGVERLVGALFLAGATSRPAWRAKLSLLAYWLVDGGFLQPRAVAEGFRWALALLITAVHEAACDLERRRERRRLQQKKEAAPLSPLLLRVRCFPRPAGSSGLLAGAWQRASKLRALLSLLAPCAGLRSIFPHS